MKCWEYKPLKYLKIIGKYIMNPILLLNQGSVDHTLSINI